MAKEELNQPTLLVSFSETFIIKQSHDCIFDGGISQRTGTFKGHNEYLIQNTFPAPFVNNLDFEFSASVTGFQSDKDHNIFYDTQTIINTHTSFGLKVRLSKGIKGLKITVRGLGYVKESDLYTPKPQLRILGRPVYNQSQVLPLSRTKSRLIAKKTSSKRRKKS